MRRDEKMRLVRLAAVGEGGAAVDFEARGEGRGGYLHLRPECLDRFVNARVKEFRSLGRRLEREERTRIADTLRARLDSSIALG
jgi:predicted RNA-binding protein YlxR (DUF448 family)